ncbi:MAG: NUDIX hydrolase [Pseudomonadales bacterium]
MHRRKLLTMIDDYARRYPDEMAVAERFRTFVCEHERCFERDCWAGHITGSAWLVNRTGSHVLLTHHRKLGRWLQLGGHSDGEADTLVAAKREAEEESGLVVDVLEPAIFDLDVHEIPARKSDPAHHHYDVRFLFVAKSDAFRVSAESLDLSWVRIDELTAHSREESVLRMGWKWQARRGVTKSNTCVGQPPGNPPILR